MKAMITGRNTPGRGLSVRGFSCIFAGKNVLAPVILFMLAGMVSAAAQTIVVAPEGPIRSVGEAVRMAETGTRIVVRPGVYEETSEIRVDRSVSIIGEGRPVLRGRGDHQILVVTVDSVTIRGLTFQNVETAFVEDRAALQVDGARACLILDNRFENAFFGIRLTKTAGCRIEKNEFLASKGSVTLSGNGIHLWYSNDILVRNNTIRGHRDGIYLEFVKNGRILENRSEGNLRYGLHFMFSDSCAYRGNVFKGNDAGVAVMYSKRVEMTDNRFEENWGPASFGLLLKDITDSQITGNFFRKNTVALYAEASNRVQVEKNDFLENGWAVKIMANAEDNVFTRNNFIANSFDVATNSRQSFSTFEGNYWDNYQGYDLDRDGVGDVPFRPVRLFALLVERNEPSLLLMRSFFVDLLDATERIIPALTPQSLLDEKPSMRRIS